MGVIWIPGPEPEPPSLADKVQWLIEHLWPGGDAPDTNDEAAKAIRLRTGKNLSATRLWKLRAGRDGNPTLSVLTALAAFFRVSLSFFEDRGEDPRLDADRAALFSLGGMDGASIDLLHALSDLRPDERAFASAVIKALATGTWQEPERGELLRLFTPRTGP